MHKGLRKVAVFYPNLMGMITVQQGKMNLPLLATTDAFTYCHEIRHFIDVDAFRTLENGFETIRECVPPCRSISGKGMDKQRVVGMVNGTLNFSYDVTLSGKKTGQTASLVLDNVLVIDRLPVPLHISVKRLMLKGSQCDSEALNSIVNALGSVKWGIPLKPENLPIGYRNHPYWNSSSTDYLVMSDYLVDWRNYLKSFALHSSDSIRLVR